MRLEWTDKREAPSFRVDLVAPNVDHAHEPDFLARLDGIPIVLQIKGFEDNQTKHNPANRRVEAVNNWGQLGTVGTVTVSSLAIFGASDRRRHSSDRCHALAGLWSLTARTT